MPVLTSPPTDSGSDALGTWEAELLSDGGGLTQFGAFIETLTPGSASSRPHWHAREDEMVYLLSGTVTVVEGEARQTLRPGQAACFKAGVAVPHRLENTSDSPARYMVIGTRSGDDVVTYAEGDTVTVADGSKTYRDLGGQITRVEPYHGTKP